ncbi:MAG: M15 family metallopeptidase [Pseudomonadota bacterium]
MGQIARWALAGATLLLAACTTVSDADDRVDGPFSLFRTAPEPVPDIARPPTDGRPADIGGNQGRLMAAYPGAFSFEGNIIVFPDGTRVAWDDGKRKTPADLLTGADVEDMFHWPYPRASAGKADPPKLHDPGRVRSQAFFRALYGGSRGAVQRTLRTVPWVPTLGGGTVSVTTRFGIDGKIAAISRELEQLPSRFHKYLRPSGGAFNWRVIAGTDRLSVHSFGAAVDVNTKYSNYWRWEGQRAGGTIPFRNQIPMEIVAVFEKHCFIWGGRWYHYDTMHFEYRPELLPGCRRG